jgi:preprotein translocase subunit SecG
MTLAAINWLSISIDLLLVIFVIVCLLMTLIILMQRPKQEGLGAAFGGGVTDQVFGARTTNVLQRGTVYLGSLFFIISLTLAVLIGQKNKTASTVTKTDSAAKVEKAVEPAKALIPNSPNPNSPNKELPAETPAPIEAPAPTPPAQNPTPTPPADATPASTAPADTGSTPADK